MFAVVLAAFSFVFAGCDTAIGGPSGLLDEITPSIQAGDADILSFVGKRYEKYVFKMDRAILNRLVSLPAPSEFVAKNNDSGMFVSDYKNSITVDNIPLRYLVEGGTHSVQVTGNVITRSGKNMNYTYYNNSVSGARELQFDTDKVGRNPEYERYEVLTSFGSDSLALPLTGSYSNPYDEYKYRTFSYLIPIAKFDGWYTLPKDHTSMASNLTCSVLTFERYILASRNFYQYKNLTVTFDPDKRISDLKEGPIVEEYDYDEESNVLHITLKDYDEQPYSGPVFSFRLQAADGTVREKTISIGDLEG
jgi:hypothetical protein